MAWDPSVLRKYSTTGHFRLLNQLRSELKGNPLVRPQAGETVGSANRSKSLIRALEVRPQSGGYGRGRRPLQSAGSNGPSTPPVEGPDPSGRTFRDRLNAIDMR
jgi:hypothetical protein